MESLLDHFPTRSLAKNSVIRYVNLLNKIAVEYYQGKLNAIFLDGEIEIDETFLFKDKKSKAKHRRNKRSLWLFGMIQREDHQFVITPVYSRDESTLLPIMLKHIKLGATVYSDSFSTYVNNRVFPKESRLQEYGFQHQWGDHQIEFVSSTFQQIHTNTIERLWLTIKTDFRKKNIKKIRLSHIARFFFHKNSRGKRTAKNHWKWA